MSKSTNTTSFKKVEEKPTLPNINTGIPHYKRFTKLLKMSQTEIKSYLKSYLLSVGYKKVIDEDGFLFAKGDVDILLTAHMDTTPTVGGKKRIAPKVIYTSPEGIVSSPQGIGGDDRCGIYIITEIIKETKCSVLFCEDEEIGCVGSTKFSKSKYLKQITNMRYMIEVDRKGKSDLVFYDCDNPDFEDFLLDNLPDYKTEWGTCSDISVLMEMSGVAGVNISSGYYNEHHIDETINLADMENTLKAIKNLVKLDSESFEFIDAYENWDWNNKGYTYYGHNGWGNGNYTSSSRQYSEVILYVVYKEGDEEVEAMSFGSSWEIAFFNFFQDHTSVCMDDVVDWYTEQTPKYNYSYY